MDDAISDDIIVAVTQHCHQLEKISLSLCPDISDISMQALAESCRHLTCLRLYGMTGLDSPSLLADIARNNVGLKYDMILVDECGELFAEASVLEELEAITAGR